MIVSIHQPDYIPWLGFFYKMAHCDVFVYLDDAQYSNEAAHNFNVIKTPQGAHRLKIPVSYHFGDPINRVTPRNELRWKEKHLKTLEMNYTKARYFREIFPGFCEAMLRDYGNIAQLNMGINDYICKGFGIFPRILRSSEMDIHSVREERILDICESLGATEYLSGNGARAYQKEENFQKRGITLTYLDYKPIEYRQLWKEFQRSMSVLDYIFNCGFDWQYVEDAVEILNHQE